MAFIWHNHINSVSLFDISFMRWLTFLNLVSKTVFSCFCFLQTIDWLMSTLTLQKTNKGILQLWLISKQQLYRLILFYLGGVCFSKCLRNPSDFRYLQYSLTLPVDQKPDLLCSSFQLQFVSFTNKNASSLDGQVTLVDVMIWLETL